ncbi:MAG TPA: hypothetical protein VFF67_04460 [Thermoplasmata archaeon]|nr:hypothetical protein [Thermoplasmata archaeon]
MDSTTFSMFNTACSSPTFQNLAQGYGFGNFSVEFFGSSSGLAFANFTFNWEVWQTGLGPSSDLLTAMEWWSGTLSNGNVNGPYAPIHHRSMRVGIDSTHTWAGYKFFGPGTPSPTLNGEGGYAYVANFQAPACALAPCLLNVPHGVTIDPVGAVWTGLNDSTAQGLQTGYVYDQANYSQGWCTGQAGGCDYGLFWEQSGRYAQPYTNYPTAAAGNVLEEEIYNSYTVCASGTGGKWTMEIINTNTTGVWTKSLCLGEFKPIWAPMIYETPWLKVAGQFFYQQTPKFGPFGQVEFDDAFVNTSTALYSAAYLLLPPPGGCACNIPIQMNEKGTTINAAPSYSTPCGLSFIVLLTTSCQFIGWSSSYYDYNHLP